LFRAEAWHAAAQAAQALKLALIDVRVGARAEIGQLAALCGRGGCDALFVMPDPNFSNWRAQIIEQAVKLRLPAVYHQPEYVLEGGLISYSANVEEMFRRAAAFVDKILKGANPADLPLERPTKFELVINLRSVRTLGLAVPDAVLLRADRVIE
jgi:putative ABC transport system substrate-binding protein